MNPNTGEIARADADGSLPDGFVPIPAGPLSDAAEKLLAFKSILEDGYVVTEKEHVVAERKSKRRKARKQERRNRKHGRR